MNEVQREQSDNSQPKPKNKKVLLIIILVVVVLLGIGLKSILSPRWLAERAIEQASDGKVKVDMSNDGTVRVNDKDGNSYTASTGGAASLPDGWPSGLPVVDGAKITYSGSVANNGKTGLSVVFTTSNSVADVTKFYKDKLAADGWTTNGTMNTPDGSVISATKAENQNFSVYMSASDEGTNVTLGLQQ